MEKQKPNFGLSVHCHHDILVEYCYSYKERVEYTKNNKPENEQETRLRLFKILPEEAEKDIPKDLLQANQAWEKANQTWEKACQAWEQIDQAWKQSYQAREQSYQAWPQESKNAFHKKWCGCKEWKNGVINFA